MGEAAQALAAPDSQTARFANVEFNQPIAQPGKAGRRPIVWLEKAGLKSVVWLGNRGLKLATDRLRTGDPTATIDRLFHSQHVKDLQLIAAAAFLFGYFSIIGAVILAIATVVIWHFKNNEPIDLALWFWRSNSSWVDILYNSYVSSVNILYNSLYYVLRNMGRELLSLAALFGALGAALAWAYRAGSARLGVVDLFACEIGTLCRAAAVVEAVRRCVERFEEGPAEGGVSTAGLQPLSRPFSSVEDYFPVFQSNSRDLEALDERTVVYITEFYTYMKAMRDMQRALSQTRPGPADLIPPSPPSVGPWREAARDVVYMLYLALESARHATDQLVEFEPERVERTIVILNSELEAYRFLCGQFLERDARRERLRFREGEYQQLIRVLLNSVRKKPGLKEIDDKQAHDLAGKLWRQARLLLPKLMARRRAALPRAVATAGGTARPAGSSAPGVNSSGGGRDVRAACQPSVAPAPRRDATGLRGKRRAGRVAEESRALPGRPAVS